MVWKLGEVIVTIKNVFWVSDIIWHPLMRLKEGDVS
jgi:hypothetical protein